MRGENTQALMFLCIIETVVLWAFKNFAWPSLLSFDTVCMVGCFLAVLAAVLYPSITEFVGNFGSIL